jgi:integrase
MDILIKYKEYLKARNQSMVYYNYIKLFLTYCNSKQINYLEINQQIITDFFNGNNYSPNSKNNFIKAGRSFYNFLNIPRENNEWFKIRMLEIARKEIEVIDLKDIEKVVKSVATYNSRLNADKIEIILLLMFYTIIRKSELLSLKRQDIDIVNGEMKIYEQKTKQENIIDFPLNLIPKIIAYFNAYPEENNAFNITFAEINYLFRGVMTKVLGKKCKPHLTRHGGIRYLLSKIPPQDVQSMAGHKDIRTTLQYGIVNREERKKTYRQKIG